MKLSPSMPSWRLVAAYAAVSVAVWGFSMAMFFGPMDGSWYVASSVAERVFSHERPVCEPVSLDPEAPPPTADFASDGNKFIVTVENASCAWLDLNIDKGPDVHYVWEFNTLLEYRHSKTMWASVSYDAPWTLTAVGPGGTATTSGEFRVEAG